MKNHAGNGCLFKKHPEGWISTHSMLKFPQEKGSRHSFSPVRRPLSFLRFAVLRRRNDIPTPPLRAGSAILALGLKPTGQDWPSSSQDFAGSYPPVSATGEAFRAPKIMYKLSIPYGGNFPPLCSCRRRPKNLKTFLLLQILIDFNEWWLIL